MLFDNIHEEILNAFSIQMKISEWQRKLENKRTPKKYYSAIREEIGRLEKVYAQKRAIEKGEK